MIEVEFGVKVFPFEVVGEELNSKDLIVFMNGKILVNLSYQNVILVLDPHRGRYAMGYDISLPIFEVTLN